METYLMVRRKGMMTINYLLALGLATGVVLSAFELVNLQPAHAKPIFLADLQCPNVIKGDLWVASKDDVVLSREIYTSLMRLYGSDAEFACKLPSAKSADLDLEVGLPSDAGGSTVLNFYLNGTQVISEKISPGKVTVINEKLTGRSDIPYQVGGRRTLVIETICVTGSGCGRIRFFKANLNVVSNPGAKQ
jgi:hypothetical protein